MHPDRAPFALRTTLRSPLFASRWRTLKSLAVSGALPASAGAVAGSGAGSGTSVGGAAAGRSRLSPQGMVGDSPASTVQQPGYGVLQRSRECGEADGGLWSVQQCSLLHMRARGGRVRRGVWCFVVGGGGCELELLGTNTVDGCAWGDPLFWTPWSASGRIPLRHNLFRLPPPLLPHASPSIVTQHPPPASALPVQAPAVV
jgi:hypothetical protein